jgi:biotin carboxylase
LSDRIVLVMHTTSYGAAGFADACRRAGAEVAVASDRCHVLDRAWLWPDDAIVIDFMDPEAAGATVADEARRAGPVAAVLPVGGELPARVAAAASRRLGLDANAPDAMIAASNKLVMRQRLAGATLDGKPLPQPRFAAVPRATDPERVAALVGDIGFPCVVKPLALSGSRGVIRADDPATLSAAFARLARLLAVPAVRHLDPEAAEHILVESFIPGREIALEGLLSGGVLDVLTLFDKPDPLDGPFFEETLYVTPSRLPPEDQQRVARSVAAAAAALGLTTGPVHAELRLAPISRRAGGSEPSQGSEEECNPVLIEVAARPIGGLCARALKFDGQLGLEDVVIRHALARVPRPARDPRPAGVMMIPIPAHRPAVLRAVDGIDEARAVRGVADVVISTRVGETVVPLPEGNSYLGFIFATADTPAEVETALRDASARLRFTFAALLSP